MFQDKVKLKRLEQKAKEYKAQAEEAKRDLVKERVKNAHIMKQLQQFSYREPEKKVNDLARELSELTKCFEKSEQIRK